MLRSSHARRMSHQATRTVTLCIAACAGLSLVAFAQSTACHSGMQMKALPAPESLPVPVKMTGIGNSHIAIKATPEAQAWFDQGLNLLHDFWDYESARAFEQAIRVDPQLRHVLVGSCAGRGSRGNRDRHVRETMRWRKRRG